VPARIEQGGQALIPARQFLGILREAEGELTISSEPHRVWVRGHDAEFELRSDDASRFPCLPPWPDGPSLEIPAEPLRLALERTLFAAAKAAPSNLRGILWEIETDRVRLVATDTRRLAVAEVPLPGQTEPSMPLPLEALVPVEAMEVLQRLAGVAEGPVQALFRSRHVFYRGPAAILCARLLNARFPAWRKALPGEARYHLLLPAGPFLAAVKQAVVLRDRTEARLLLRFQGSRVTLRSRQAGTGRTRVQQALVFPCTRDPVEVAFNPAYLTELLKVLDAEATVRLELKDPETAALFRVGDDYKHVVMPLRPR
jgi:DNA polymerase-3 subunit beta